jgi:hypothetical protein
LSAAGERSPRPESRESELHLTLTEEDRRLLDELAARLGVSQAETISRGLHLLKSLQDRARGQ